MVGKASVPFSITLLGTFSSTKWPTPTVSTPVRNLWRCWQSWFNSTTQEGDLICDPFGGSCMVADACKGIKRKCLVVELDEGLVKMASLRIRGFVMVKETIKLCINCKYLIRPLHPATNIMNYPRTTMDAKSKKSHLRFSTSRKHCFVWWRPFQESWKTARESVALAAPMQCGLRKKKGGKLDG